MKVATPRQKQIMELLCKGYNDKQIALILGISHQTARNTIQALIERTNTNNRIHALVKLVKDKVILL